MGGAGDSMGSSMSGGTNPKPATCKATEKKCSGVCVNTNTDPTHCGGCNKKCQNGQTCGQGTCRGGSSSMGGAGDSMGGSSGGSMGGSSSTGVGASCTKGTCQLTSTKCSGTFVKGLCPGAANVQCCQQGSGSGGSMSGGSGGGSMPTCKAAETKCSGTCVNTNTDVNHCGACSKKCPSGQSCSQGTCKSSGSGMSGGGGGSGGDTSGDVPIVMESIRKGESPGDRIARILREFVGSSLKTRKDDLGRLVARGVDKPDAVVGIKTNCGTSALGVMALAGVKDHLLNTKYQSGMAISWLRTIGQHTGALHKYKKGDHIKPGSLLRYNTAGKNDDHVEWLLSEIDAQGNADHGGGGRADNAITEAHGNVLSSFGRPLVEYWDPDELGIPTK